MASGLRDFPLVLPTGNWFYSCMDSRILPMRGCRFCTLWPQRGYHAVAVNQRGYSPEARPRRVEDYATGHLVTDALGFADCLKVDSFHLVAHDWGGLLAWQIAAVTLPL